MPSAIKEKSLFDDLKTVLNTEIEQLRAGTIPPDNLQAIARAAGVIVKATQTELVYSKMRGEVPKLKSM